jgi:hypothetical protein
MLIEEFAQGEPQAVTKYSRFHTDFRESRR